MAKRKHNTDNSNATSATVGYEAELWKMADALRGSMDAAEYKHVVLGLIFLKYISDAFEEQHKRLEAERAQGADPEDPDEYRAVNIFWVPKEARWATLKAQAKQPTIGQVVDNAMASIERDNPALKGVLPKEYARPALDKQRLGQLIDLISNIRVGDDEARAKDVLGRVYEYFLSQFASAEGKKGGEFYTPRCVVKLLVEMLEPFQGRVYDPCCGSAGMFVQSVEFIRAHATGNGNGGRARADISIYGQESNYTTWRLAKMNLAIRGIEGQIAHGDTFHNDRFPDLKANYILANPPFNVSDWGGERLKDDKRWKYGVPPAGNANFAWVQHIIYHLAPNGVAGFVLANGSMSSNQSGEGEIRKNIIEADLVDCMVALPGQLFYSTQIPACLWFLARDRRGGSATRPYRDRRGQVLFIDARKLGRMVDRTHRELTDEEIRRIADTYHAWRGEVGADGRPPEYADVPGFCKSATLEEIRKHGYVLTPGRYVGAEVQEDDDEPFAEKMQRLVAQLREQQAEAAKLDAAIAKNLEELGGMAKKKEAQQRPSNNEIRRIMLQYFYDRNKNATSARGKKGSAVKIRDVKKELKASHGLTQQEVQSNLTYLISQGWVEEVTIEKSITAPGGTVIPSSTNYYRITAAGIDKIEGPGEFTMSKFHGIRIEATGQNIITLGDGNQINAQFNELGSALAELRKAITESDATEANKLALVADIDTIQSQLAKPAPNKRIIAAAWETVKTAATIDGCVGFVKKVAGLIGGTADMRPFKSRAFEPGRCVYCVGRRAIAKNLEELGYGG